jgi:hypothetical protein
MDRSKSIKHNLLKHKNLLLHADILEMERHQEQLPIPNGRPYV